MYDQIKASGHFSTLLFISFHSSNMAHFPVHGESSLPSL